MVKKDADDLTDKELKEEYRDLYKEIDFVIEAAYGAWQEKLIRILELESESALREEEKRKEGDD